MPKSRVVADLMLRGVDLPGWQAAVGAQNILQARNPATAIRLERLIRNLLELTGPDLWKLIRDGSAIVATHAVLAAAVKHSPVLCDFLDLVVRDQYRIFAKALTDQLWNDYLGDCRGRDPDMPRWNELTRRRLRSSVLQILAQAGSISDTKAKQLQTVHIASQVLRCLKKQDDSTSSDSSRWHRERCPNHVAD